MDSDGHKGFSVHDGELTKYDGKDSFVTVPEGVTVIWEFAFRRTPVKRVLLPSTLLRIDGHAFEGCELEFNEYGGGLYLGCEGNDYFVLYSVIDCANIEQCNVHPQTRIIASDAFEGCKKLRKVILPDGILRLGSYAFFESGLEEINLPDSLEYIGAGCFADCNIKAVTLPEKVTEINDCTFGGCACLTRIELHGGVTRVGIYAFEECFSLESIDLGAGVTALEVGAFENCHKLKSVTAEKVKTIEANVFRGCVNLSSLRLGALIEEVGEVAFENCKALTLTELISAKRIGYRAFNGCCSLERIALSEAISFLGKEAFAGCERLQLIIFHGDKRAWTEFEEEYMHASSIGSYKVKITE